jgi:hypothetical protein
VDQAAIELDRDAMAVLGNPAGVVLRRQSALLRLIERGIVVVEDPPSFVHEVGLEGL